MAARIGIVCDSTCDLGTAVLAALGVEMVPLKVTFGDTSYLDWVELGPEQFFEKLAAAPALPTTSQPSPADFAAVYARLADEGCEEIVSIHLTSALSGTIESALMAAANAPVPVRVIDTLTVCMGVALPLLAAVDARNAGADGATIEAAARAVVKTTRILFALNTLDYLVKGGRAGKAQGLAASLLSIKPVLTTNAEGTIEPFKKLKGTAKAIQAIADEIAAAGAGGAVRVGILHSMAPQLVEALRSAIDATGVDVSYVDTIEVGAVIGTYAGPGAIGAAFHPVS